MTLLWELLYKAFGLSMVIAVMLTASIAATASSSKSCSLPPVPFHYNMAGYKVDKTVDYAGTLWIHLYVALDYGKVVLVKKLDQFEANDMGKATKEGNQWLKCVEEKSKKLPPIPQQPVPKLEVQ